jgi:hypothetical protein
VICQFSISCPEPTPHAPTPGVITWAHGMELEPPEPPRAAVMAPEKLSRAACATELRWGSFLSVPSRGTRRHRLVRVSNRHAARGIAGNLRPRGGLGELAFKGVFSVGFPASPLFVGRLPVRFGTSKRAEIYRARRPLNFRPLPRGAFFSTPCTTWRPQQPPATQRNRPFFSSGAPACGARRAPGGAPRQSAAARRPTRPDAPASAPPCHRREPGRQKLICSGRIASTLGKSQ